MAVGIGLYDEVEMLAGSARLCEITFIKDLSRAVIHGRIREVSEPGPDAFLKMDSGLTIPLADLRMINGKNWSPLA